MLGKAFHFPIDCHFSYRKLLAVFCNCATTISAAATAGIVKLEPVGMSPTIKIICVDDDISILQTVKDCLCEHFLVAIAGSALKGLDLMKAYGPFDIVMSDHEMPGMKGMEFLSLVAERWPETIRILMSGGCMDIDSVTRAITAGHISRFIPKPFDAVTLAGQFLEEFNGDAEPVKQECGCYPVNLFFSPNAKSS